MSLPLRRAVARLYRIDGGLSNDSRTVRGLAEAFNQARGARAGGTRRSDEVVHAGEIQALVLLHELLAPAIVQRTAPALLARLESELGEDTVAGVVRAFELEFDLPDGLLDESDPGDSGAPSAATSAELRRLRVLGELLLVWLLNRNPAFSTLRELFDDSSPVLGADYQQLASSLVDLLSGDDLLPLDSLPDARPAASQSSAPQDWETRPVTALAELVSAAPVSINGQLRHVLDNWMGLASGQRDRVLRVLDTLAEEEVRPPPGPGPVQEPTIAVLGWAPGPMEEIAPPLRSRYEPRWMSEAVVVAKNTRVWLDQISRETGRKVGRLDEVPESELNSLVEQGLNCLWLIGVWERSPASASIKRRRSGNPGASASAYSVFDYRVSEDLGGDAAMESLQTRAASCGLRIGVDVVPNHMGIDSIWMREHPEWFVSCEQSPYPSYRFTGPNLSGDPRIGIYLEDHYDDGSDAAVVFLRRDLESGEDRFVYHGNDGTSTPWNDTAQLDYTRADVRQAMAGVILSLASRFRLLRFDAAMTLTRQHFQRLWYPAPGDGGAVPSRSDFGLSREQFKHRMPAEFWGQVCKRVAEECPETLLVAEAFWMLEGFFVREIGMARVYNSAFMRLLQERGNAGFRRMLFETVAVDPRILGRYANFLTNPDEATAIEQFGRLDRYFGACTALATLPGLPLFGHGQVDGMKERYGMDFDRALLPETPDAEMVERHRREIAPLLKQRSRFNDSETLRCLRMVDRQSQAVDAVLSWRGGGLGTPFVVVFNNSDVPVEGWLRPEEGSGLQSAGSPGPGDLVSDLFDTLVESGEGDDRAPDRRTQDADDSSRALVEPAGSSRARLFCFEERTGARFSWPRSEARRLGLALTLGPGQALVLSGFSRDGAPGSR